MNKIPITVLVIFIFLSLNSQSKIDKYGAITRSDGNEKTIYLFFSGHDFDEGFDHVLNVLNQQKIWASFFLTGDFIRSHKTLVNKIAAQGHFVGAHSDKHLLYNDWTKRDSLLYSTDHIRNDISTNLRELKHLGIKPTYFLPPYEWYNSAVVKIAQSLNQITVNFTSGTRSNADYTTPDMSNYSSSEAILERIYTYEEAHGLNGFHLLIHPGTHPLRKDKLYLQLDILITNLRQKGYQFSKLK